ncbi:MAG: MmcQ/YjbR family DNA-binding protein [Paracoccaceae bacterium]
MIHTYIELRAFALSLDLPMVEDGTAWGNPCLRAHGKMWVWWSPLVDAAVFACDFDEREMLLEADPQAFTLHPHYRNHKLILVNAGHIDPDWAGPRLIAQWRAKAPKRWLKDWDAQRLSSV